MSVVVVTGSCGLIGAESVRHFSSSGHKVVGIDNNMREYFFGADGSTNWVRENLVKEVGGYEHHQVDIRDTDAVNRIFSRYGKEITLVVHTAAQPSHDWAAREPLTDFSVNANGTIVLLEATRLHAPEAVFIFTSTNKVYGDTPNFLPLVEQDTRWEIDPAHPFAVGIDESMSIDQSKHSLFGASKVAADVLVQEYGRYFGLRSGVFRGGCLTGPGHSGAQLHGFLAYLVKCVATGRPYTIFGYRGKQVRDNIHSADLVAAFESFYRRPRVGEVYNIGGGRQSNCSMLEAISIAETLAGKKLDLTYSEDARSGDHIWYVSDLARFKSHFPSWDIRHDVPQIIEQIYENGRERWERESP